MKKVIAIVSIAAFALSASTAFAFGGWFSSSDVVVVSNNDAYVKNVVDVGSNTGGNQAWGGDAKNKVSGKGDNGGNDASGGDGDVSTGDAYAASSVTNLVNSNSTKVKTDCGCKGDINVESSNGARVKNYVGVEANSGVNVAGGGDAKNKVYGSSSHHHYSSGGSNGGNDATGGDGDVTSGDATAGSSVVNVVNSNVTRVRR